LIPQNRIQLSPFGVGVGQTLPIFVTGFGDGATLTKDLIAYL